MRKILLSMLLAVSLVAFDKAQEAGGETPEEVKNEIMKIEGEKQAALRKGVPAIVEWFDRYNADDMAHTDPGSGVLTKAQVMANFQSGKNKAVPVKTFDYKLRVYGNGTTAVLTYRNTNTLTIDGKTDTHEHFSTDVYVKENGAWRRVVHHASLPPKQ